MRAAASAALAAAAWSPPHTARRQARQVSSRGLSSTLLALSLVTFPSAAAIPSHRMASLGMPLEWRAISWRAASSYSMPLWEAMLASSPVTVSSGARKKGRGRQRDCTVGGMRESSVVTNRKTLPVPASSKGLRKTSHASGDSLWASSMTATLRRRRPGAAPCTP